MKLRALSPIFLLALTAGAFAHAGRVYVSAFGGGGSSNNVGATQLGTAFYSEAEGGPLAVNAFGTLGSQGEGFYGAQLGYQAPAILFKSLSNWSFSPAGELEGYFMGKNTFSGMVSNTTDRLPEHVFAVSYPMTNDVLLVNAILNFNRGNCHVHPYVGFGIGSAIESISGANAAQTSPAEANVNHYNSDSSDSDTTFAGQIKLGLSYDITHCIGLFADYRWLYVGNTHFVFGSTVYSSHVPTSSWQVKLNHQHYNSGAVGLRFKFSE